MKISTILSTKGVSVVTIGPQQSIQEAVATLAAHNIGALVVLDETGKPVGIISERDIIRALKGGAGALSQTVSQVMTQSIVVGSPNDDVQSVIQTMTLKRFRHLPIVDRGKLAGIISIGDAVKAQLDESRGEIDTLQTQIIDG